MNLARWMTARGAACRHGPGASRRACATCCSSGAIRWLNEAITRSALAKAPSPTSHPCLATYKVVRTAGQRPGEIPGACAGALSSAAQSFGR